MAVVINGSDIFVYIDGAKVANATSHSLDMTMTVRETSNKDTGKFNTKDTGRLEITVTCDQYMVYTDFATMMTAYLAREPVHLHLAEDIAGSPDETQFYAEGDFIITSLHYDAADQTNASNSCTFEHYDGFAWSGDVALRVGVLGTNCSAPDADDGFTACFPKGGTAPYTFVWSRAAEVTQYITACEPGTYTVTVTDDVAAEVTGSITITEPA